MRVVQANRSLSALLLTLGMVCVASVVSAGAVSYAATDPHELFPTGAKLESENKEQWLSIGMGVRASFASQENGSANGDTYSNTFGIQNARIYVNGALNRYLKFEFNTECFNCPGSANGAGGGNGNGGAGPAGEGNFFGGNSTIGVLDLIGKFEVNQYANLWVGRMLVPGERGELNGPFFHATYDGFRTPFNSADFSGNFGNGGAGLYGRDDGAVFWGEANTEVLRQIQYSLGMFKGLRSSGSGCGGPCGPNQANNFLYAGRLTLNFLNPEKNPGYYTAGTYYGKAGDILALAGGFNYQANGAGSFQHPSDLTIFTSDVLFEKVLPNNGGVFTLNAEFKRYWADYSTLAFSDPGTGGSTTSAAGNNFGIFRGTSVTAYALYLLPQMIGPGRFQPYGRYTYIDPQDSLVRREYELGLNYVIKGFNSRISAFWQYGDINSKGKDNYAPNASGDMISRYVLAYQFQY